jgi:hypothetical protein
VFTKQCALVALFTYSLHFAVEVGVLMDAKVLRHLAQLAEHRVAADLLQGALTAQRELGVRAVARLWRLF